MSAIDTAKSTNSQISYISNLRDDHFTVIFSYLNINAHLILGCTSNTLRIASQKPNTWIDKAFAINTRGLQNDKFVENNITYNILKGLGNYHNMNYRTFICCSKIKHSELISLKACPNVTLYLGYPQYPQQEHLKRTSFILNTMMHCFTNLRNLTLSQIKLPEHFCKFLQTHPSLTSLTLIESVHEPECIEAQNAFIEVFKVNRILTSLSIEIISSNCVKTIAYLLAGAQYLHTLEIHNRIVEITPELKEEYEMLISTNKSVRSFTYSSQYGQCSKRTKRVEFKFTHGLESVTAGNIRYMDILRNSKSTLRRLEFTDSDSIRGTHDPNTDCNFLTWLSENSTLETLVMPRVTEAEPDFQMPSFRYYTDEELEEMFMNDNEAPKPHSFINPEFMNYCGERYRISLQEAAGKNLDVYTRFSAIVKTHPSLLHLTLAFGSFNCMIIIYKFLLRRFTGCGLHTLRLVPRAYEIKSEYNNKPNQINAPSHKYAVSNFEDMYSAAYGLLDSSPQLHLELQLFSMDYENLTRQNMLHILATPSKFKNRLIVMILKEFPE